MLQKNYYIFIFVFIVLAILLITRILVGNKKDTQKSLTSLNTGKEISKNKSTFVRNLAVSGSFYSSNEQELAVTIQNLLENVDLVAQGDQPRIIIVPHAGLKYSGAVQAAAFKQLENFHYNKIFLLGVGHSLAQDHAALIAQGEWETPFGNLEIAQETAQNLLDQKYIIEDTTPHVKEHSLEMQSLFLKQVLPDTKIIPILLGHASEETLNNLAYKIASNFDDNSLLIISTDLSHYPKYEDALLVDTNTIESILTNDENLFLKALQENSQKGFANLSTSACGEKPIRVGLKVAELLNINKIEKLLYKNSGDITQDLSRVVGYTSIIFTSSTIGEIKISDLTKSESLKIARTTLERLFNPLQKIHETNDKQADLPFGAFVTLYKNDNLRGCIGTFEPNMPLKKVVSEMTQAAATKDPRFQPVAQDELSNIQIEVSVLSPLKKVQTWQEIKVGEHGVKIIFNNKSGTFLPQVATDNNWNLETFLENLCEQKVGMAKDCYKNKDAQIYVYTAEHFKE